MSGSRAHAGSAGARPPVRTHVYPANAGHPGHVARTKAGWVIACTVCEWVSPVRERLAAAAYDYAGHANDCARGA